MIYQMLTFQSVGMIVVMVCITQTKELYIHTKTTDSLETQVYNTTIYHLGILIHCIECPIFSNFL